MKGSKEKTKGTPGFIREALLNASLLLDGLHLLACILLHPEEGEDKR